MALPRAATLTETVGATLRQKMVALVDPIADMVERTVSVFSNLTTAEQLDVVNRAASINLTAKIQDRIDYWTANGGARIVHPDGDYLVHGLVLKDGVSLVNTAGAPMFARARGSLTNHGVNYRSPVGAVGWTIDTPATTVYRSFVEGINLLGPGAGSSCGGIRHQNVRYSGVLGCSVENYAEWGILQIGAGQSVYAGNFVQNCLLDRTRSIDKTTMPHGLIELRGNDNWLLGPGEYNGGLIGVFGAAVVTGTCQAGSATGTVVLAASEPAADDTYNGYLIDITGGTGSGQVNYITAYTGATKTGTLIRNWLTTPDATSAYRLTPMRVVAGAVKGADNWVRDCMFEFGEGGLWLRSTSDVNHGVDQCVTDQNAGPGFILAGAAQLELCRGSRNSQGGDGNYDDFLLLAEGAGTIANCRTGGLTTDAAQPRHGFNSTASGASARWHISSPRRGGARRGKLISVLDTYGASVSGIDGMKSFSTGTVLSMEGFTSARFLHAAATTVTQFTEVYTGLIYSFNANSANVTLANGTWIKTKSGANIVMSSVIGVAFMAMGGVLYEL